MRPLPLSLLVEPSSVLPPGLLEDATLTRLDAAAGQDVSIHLRIGDLEASAKGVLVATVTKIDPIRPFNRKRGGEGLRGRVTLTDESGDIDLVLWDEETRFVRDGTFAPGIQLRILGPSVKAGFRGGLELGLGGAKVEPLAPVPKSQRDDLRDEELVGTFLELGPARIVGEPPAVRIQADLAVATVLGTVRVALEGELIRTLRTVALGQSIRLAPVTAHPVLDGWRLAAADCAIVP